MESEGDAQERDQLRAAVAAASERTEAAELRAASLLERAAAAKARVAALEAQVLALEERAAARRAEKVSLERVVAAHNDIDYCLRLRAKGYLVVWTPHATLLHFESATRKALHPPEDEALMKGRWGTLLADDPYYSPNLSLEYEDYRLRL
jgi:hypothetical protein